ncbi:NYN domain-containing protein [Nocardioides bruguierae]|uniref:NYN domain-containing protein n=1 Tax=Nocardioides bruguierae TaxID=2945102 RepID=A0A9X2D6Y9_9ACTN|nr:NYN domain-containing protein [Nocardioides bruguierae]MCL8025603.1 NYN domain-containing protein [Nocardioides bruguierae]MCM0620460.1 NYN domain-containing protein [Nocardioides bruguierae]
MEIPQYERRTVVLVDGENIDATLGNSLLGRRPTPEERPRWERVINYAEKLWNQPVVGLFFLNASGGHLPTPFIQALLAIGYRPVPLSGRPDQKVVDIGIQRTLEELTARAFDGDDEGPVTDVLLVSHDGDFAPQMEGLLGTGAKMGLVALREFTSSQLTALGLQVHDLEDDVKAFLSPLPRVRVIDLDDFDPAAFLR